MRAGQAERAHGDEGLGRTAVTAQFLDHHHVVGAKAQRVQQARGGDFRWNFRRAAVLHADALAVLELAIELRRGAADLVDEEGAFDGLRLLADPNRAAPWQSVDAGCCQTVARDERVEPLRVRHFF